MIVEEEVYLEHYGKKGMHWGERNTQKSGFQPSNAQKVKYGAAKAVGKTGKAVRKTGQWIKKHPDETVILAVGALYVVGFLASKGQSKVNSSNSSQFTKKTGSVSDLLKQERDHKVSSIIRTHKEGHIDKDQLQAFLKTINTRYDKKIAAAL